MQTFFLYYIDLAVLVLAFLTAIISTVSIKKKSNLRLRVFPLFFMILGSCLIIASMSAHLIEIIYHALGLIIEGSFKYEFKLYSLLLMVFVVGGSAFYFMQGIRQYCMSRVKPTRVIKAALIICLLTLPTLPLTPIGPLPAIACIISISALPLVRKKRKVLKAAIAA